MNEAVSSLVFASARCGDLPELLRIRELFGKRYGPRFAAAAVDLRPGNLVNHEVVNFLQLNNTRIIEIVCDQIIDLMADEKEAIRR